MSGSDCHRYGLQIVKGSASNAGVVTNANMNMIVDSGTSLIVVSLPSCSAFRLLSHDVSHNSVIQPTPLISGNLYHWQHHVSSFLFPKRVTFPDVMVAS